MVMEPLAPPAAWTWWIHATWRVGGLTHIFSEAAIEGFSLIQKIIVEINIFVSTLC